MFTVTNGTANEDSTFWVRRNRDGREIICADTGNGGAQTYELGYQYSRHARDGYEPICFAGTYLDALAAAKRELRN
jgi:hypothetical protein